MRKFLLRFIFFSTVFISIVPKTFSQTKMQETEYLAATREFINCFRSSEYPKKKVLLVDKANMSEFKECYGWLFQDSTIFTTSEQQIIRTEIENPKVTQWTNSLVDSVNFISKDTITAIFKDRKRSWDYFYYHYGDRFHSFSAPIFLRNNTLCLFYADYSCGGLCGSGIIMLYRKENGVWKYVRKFCEWES
jgi:hypothetical protein